uniref:Uncharacterized protein n=1 Tax=Anopheles atroparvus TaxID=41427 RepID=A0A182JHY3_ANOAO
MRGPKRQNLITSTVLKVLVGTVPQVFYMCPHGGDTNATHNSRVTKIQCVDMPYKRTKLNYCLMGTFSNQTNFLNASLDVPMPLNFLLLTTKLFYKYRTYRPFMIDWSVELCQALRAPQRRNLITNMVIKVIADTLPQFLYKCPHGNRTYTTTWLYPSKFVLTTVPSGEYRLDMRFLHKDEMTLFALQLFLSIVWSEVAAQFMFQCGTNATFYSRVSKSLSVDMPYKRTKLNYCLMGTFPMQTNFLNASLDVPMPLEYLIVSRKSSTRS